MPSRRAAALAVVTALLVAPAVANALPRDTPVTPTYDATATANLLAEVNAHRASIGLHALAYDARLAAVARSYTLVLAASGTLAHNDALFTPESHHALGITYLGENVGDTWAPDRFESLFLNSPHHRENMENPKFALAGFAVAVDAHGQWWATEDFGSARAAVVVARQPAPRPVPRPAPVRVVAKVRPVVRAVPRATTPAAVAPPRRSDPTPRLDAVPAAAVRPAVPATPSRLPLLLAAATLVGSVGGLFARRGRLAG